MLFVGLMILWAVYLLYYLLLECVGCFWLDDLLVYDDLVVTGCCDLIATLGCLWRSVFLDKVFDVNWLLGGWVGIFDHIYFV